MNLSEDHDSVAGSSPAADRKVKQQEELPIPMKTVVLLEKFFFSVLIYHLGLNPFSKPLPDINGSFIHPGLRSYARERIIEVDKQLPSNSYNHYSFFALKLGSMWAFKI